MFGKWKRLYQEAQHDLNTLKLVMPTDRVDLAKSLDAERNYSQTCKLEAEARQKRIDELEQRDLPMFRGWKRIEKNQKARIKKLLEENDLLRSLIDGHERSAALKREEIRAAGDLLQAATLENQKISTNLLASQEKAESHWASARYHRIKGDEAKEKIKQLKAEAVKLRAARWHKEALGMWELSKKVSTLQNQLATERALRTNGTPETVKSRKNPGRKHRKPPLQGPIAQLAKEAHVHV